MKHVSLFSQTGSEIADIAEKRGAWPDVIVSSHSDTSRMDPRIVDRDWILAYDIKGDNTKLVGVYEHILDGADLVTLHGWLKIIPAEICEDFTIYNGHPGLILDEFYRDTLRGRDPQIKTWNNLSKYPFIGSVVHEVVPEVDAGKIVNYSYTTHNCKTIQEVYSTYKKMSLSAWLEFFNDWELTYNKI